MRFTHQLAVNAYLLFNEKFLLLRRTNSSVLWGPPGGRLDRNEAPVDGLKREILEETGLQAEVYHPVTTWFGEFNGVRLLSLDYLCTASENNVCLSREHSDFAWLTITQLARHKDIYFSSPQGFKYTDFNRAWGEYLLLTKNIKELKRFLLRKY